MTLSVFFLGATGYIGGAVLLAIKRAHPEFRYTALVRSEKDAAAVQATGVSVITGSMDDRDLIASAAASHDITLNAADSDNLPFALAVLAAQKKRAAAGGHVRPIFLHTSGTSVVSDPPTGKFEEAARKIWNDNNPDDIASIAPGQPHRHVDIELFNAGESGEISTYIIAPSAIYDVAYSNPKSKVSIQIPRLVRTGLKKRQGVIIGEGTNVWSNVNIHDLTELYVLILDHALKENAHPAPPANKFANFFFASADEHAWGDVARLIAKSLHARGLVNSPDPVTIQPAEGYLRPLSNNSRSVSERGRALGWVPRHRSIAEALEDDIDAVLEADGRNYLRNETENT
ncbi:hypothetical protein BOTBODRAFT_55572 [Botryobasidium botryosum FD-172 SS1]|uniref:NmrA-like domain-containing protein n=1 Tax=Botryobasidium botryosum (strain FD-172 SS1) TaxID=930990 RepID=A0A067MEX9_BOTB1|nr:hypothetical protein BOTBODRAFT_55572 [Botryobasidium botryosum FD-172 SS1]